MNDLIKLYFECTPAQFYSGALFLITSAWAVISILNIILLGLGRDLTLMTGTEEHTKATKVLYTWLINWYISGSLFLISLMLCLWF